MIDLFTRHSESLGETYLEHMGVASSFGFHMIFVGFACLGHALLPFLFVKTGSATITELHDRTVTNRHNQTAGAGSAVAAGSD